MVRLIFYPETTPKFLSTFASTFMSHAALASYAQSPMQCCSLPKKKSHHCKISNSKVQTIPNSQARNSDRGLYCTVSQDDAAPTISAPLFPSSVDFGISSLFFLAVKKKIPCLDHSPQMTPTLNRSHRQARMVTVCNNSDCVSGIDQTSWAAGVQKCL